MKYNVLYVDDETNNLKVFKSIFRRDYKIFTASSGEEGLVILESTNIHLIITDQRMPKMTGVEFLKVVNKKWPMPNQILLTAFVDHDVVQEAINSIGIFSYLNKPYDHKQLKLLMDKALKSYQLQIDHDFAINKINEQAEMLNKILSTALDGIITIDDTYNIVMINPAANKMFGYNKEHLINQKLDILIPKTKRGVHHTHFDRFKNDNSARRSMRPNTGEVLHGLTAKGKEFPIETSLSKMTIGNKIYFNAIIRNISDRINSETELRESEEKFKNVFNSMTDVFVRSDQQGICTMISPSIYDISGYRPEEIIGKLVADFYAIPEDRSRMLETLKKDGFLKDFETLSRTKDGNELVLSFNGKAVIDKNGEPAGVEGVLRDITDKSKAEQALKESLKLTHELQFALNESSIVDITDVDGNITFVNDKFIQISKYSSDELIGVNRRIFNSGYHSNEFFENMWSTIKKGDIWQGEIKNVAKDGTFFWVDTTIVPSLDSEGKPCQYVEISIEITSKKNAQQKLLKAQHISQMGFMDWNMQSNELNWSDEIYNIYGVDPNQKPTIESTVAMVHPEDLDYVQKNLDLAVGGIKEYNIDHRIVRPDNRIIWVHAQAEVVKDAHQNPESLLGTVIDITQRKEDEEKLIQYRDHLEELIEKRTKDLKITNRELESFSYSITHDLRAPLRAIEGFIQVVKEEYFENVDDEASRLFKIIKRNTDRMGELINDLLAFSRMGNKKLHLESCDLTIMMKDIIKEIKSSNQNSITFSVKKLSHKMIDKSMMKQVFINLISNGTKFSKNKKSPKLEIGSFTDDDGNDIIYFKDNGVGFNMKYKEKLFSIFQRLHSEDEFEGTGIGLSIAKRIIDKHDGKIWAESEVDKGATFYIQLP